MPPKRARRNSPSTPPTPDKVNWPNTLFAMSPLISPWGSTYGSGTTRTMNITRFNKNNASIYTSSNVDPLDMYLGLLYPSCPVGIEAKTRKALRYYATQLKYKQPVKKLQRERFKALLDRLVAAGKRCGFPAKAPGHTYTVANKNAMLARGYVANNKNGDFFYRKKRPGVRKRNPTPNAFNVFDDPEMIRYIHSFNTENPDFSPLSNTPRTRARHV